jgi:hypothetical protein
MPEAPGWFLGGEPGLVYVSGLFRYYSLVPVPVWGLPGVPRGSLGLGIPDGVRTDGVGKLCYGAPWVVLIGLCGANSPFWSPLATLGHRGTAMYPDECRDCRNHSGR